MFGSWKVKAAKLKTVLLVGGHQMAKELPPGLARMLELFREACASGSLVELQASLDAMPPLTDAERPLHEPADINGWHFEAMFHLKNGEIWWLVHAVFKNGQVPSDTNLKLLNHVLELLGGTPADAIIAPKTSPFTENLPFGWWTWRNVSPLMEMQVNPNIKGKDCMRIVRKGAPETDGYKRMGGD